VPLDGSKFAEQALPLALRIADRAGACLEVVHVHSPCALLNLPYTSSPYYDPVQDAAYESIERAYLDAIVRRLQETALVSVTSALLDGAINSTLANGCIVDSILERARSRAADLIVMTTHGRGPLSRFWLGSVAVELVRHGPAPVLLVRPQGPLPELEAEPTWKRILIPLDGSELAERVLEPAIALGSLADAEYTLVRVVASRLVPDGYPVAAELTAVARAQLDNRSAEAQAYLDCVAKRLRTKSLRIQTHVVVGESAAAAVLGVVRDQNIDLIALATHGRSGLKRLFLGSVADKIVRGTLTSALVYRPRDNG